MASWPELRRRLAEALAALYGDVSALPRLLQQAEGRYPLHVLRPAPQASWEEALEALGRREALARLLHVVIVEHPDEEALLDVMDVMEGGWQALSNLCELGCPAPCAGGARGELLTLRLGAPDPPAPWSAPLRALAAIFQRVAP